MSKKFLIILIAIAVVLIAASAVYFVSKGNKSGKEANITRPSPSPILSPTPASSPDVNDNIGSATENPLENMPAANPMENVANPFRDSYKNPFK